jgi:intraflagellar transport protein 140
MPPLLRSYDPAMHLQDVLSTQRHVFVQDFAAAFHLGRHYEAQDKIADAIRFFTLARRFSHGVRLAKKHDLDSDLMNLALKSSKVS